MSSVQLVLDIWDAVREHLPAARRAEVAEGIMRAFCEHGLESRDVAGVADEDRDLEQAYVEAYHDGEHPSDAADDEEDGEDA